MTRREREGRKSLREGKGKGKGMNKRRGRRDEGKRVKGKHWVGRLGVIGFGSATVRAGKYLTFLTRNIIITP